MKSQKSQLLFTLFTVMIYSMVLCSCEKENGYAKKEKKENQVTMKVFCNTSGVPVRIYGYKYGGLIIKDQWEGEFVTKDWEVQLVAYCNDKTELVTLEIYVNGKLKSRGEGNSYVAIGAKLK